MTRCRPVAMWASVIAATFSLASSQAHAQPQIYLDVDEENARQGNLVPVSIFLQNMSDSIAAFQLGLTLSRPDLMAFRSDTTVQTCYECSDSACTSVVAYPCTVAIVPMTVTGTLVENWEYVEARTFGGFDIRLTGIADTDFDGFPPPIPPFATGVLIKIVAEVYCEIPDTLQDRTVIAMISPVNTYFSNPSGTLIEPLDLTEGSVTILLTSRGDLNGDGIADAVDLAVMIDVIFFGGPGVCPPYVIDMIGCDGVADAVDLAWLIDYIFFGGPPSPCPPPSP